MPLFIVDSSTLISIASNCMLWIFEKLKSAGFRFIAPRSVHKEVIESGLDSMKFKYEAVLVSRLFSENIIEVYDDGIEEEVSKFLEWANTSFRMNNQFLKVLQKTDAEVLFLGEKLKVDGILCDERTMRLFIESPDDLKKLFQKRFNADIKTDSKKLYNIQKRLGTVPVFRSVELAAIAADMGFFDDIIAEFAKVHADAKKIVLEGALNSMKFAGCGISQEEINEYVNLLISKKK